MVLKCNLRWLLMVFLFLVTIAPIYAAWNVDVNNDGCVNQVDYDSVKEKLGGIGNSNYDVNFDKNVDSEDLAIITDYMGRGKSYECDNGFKCKPEECNKIDDNCNGLVDELPEGVTNLCSDNFVCKYGNCVLLVGSCYDTDGKDIYTKGTSIGKNLDKEQINTEESCFKRDIYKNMNKIQECYGSDCFLIEYYCGAADDLLSESVACEYGCRFGKCRNIEKKCVETDDQLEGAD